MGTPPSRGAPEAPPARSAAGTAPGGVGDGLAAALIAAVGWAAVTLARDGVVRSGGLATIVVAVGGAAALLGPVVVALREVSFVRRPVGVLLAGLGLALGPLAVFAAVLRAGTHHRALGGATYAIVAGVVVVPAWLAARRLLALGGASDAAGAAARAALWLGISANVLWVARAVLQGGAPEGAGAGVLDAATGVAAAALAAVALRARLPATASGVGAPLWAAAVACGLGVAATHADVVTSLGERAPVLAAPAALLGTGTATAESPARD